MFRLIGFVIGSLLSLAALGLLVGVPRLADDEPATVEPAVTPPAQSVDASPDPAADPPAARQAAAAVPEAPPAVADAVSIDEPARLPAEAEAPAGSADPEWRSFWTPFRSRVAAEGFVGRLEGLTGLDYRVAKAGVGEYHAQFAYRDEAELDSHLETISAATGLELAERPP